MNSGSLASVWALNSSRPCRTVSCLEERERKASNIKGALKKLYGEKEWTSHTEKEKKRCRQEDNTHNKRPSFVKGGKVCTEPVGFANREGIEGSWLTRRLQLVRTHLLIAATGRKAPYPKTATRKDQTSVGGTVGERVLQLLVPATVVT